MSDTELGKRKREENGADDVNNGDGVVEGEEVGEGGSVADDLLLEELIGGAEGALDADAAAPVMDTEGGDEEEEDPSQIDLMAREILEDSQSQGTGYGPASKKPRRHFLASTGGDGGEGAAAATAGLVGTKTQAAAKRRKTSEEDEEDLEESLGEEDEEDEEEEEEEEEVEVVEENEDGDEEEDDDDAFLAGGGASKSTRTAAALRNRMRREEEGGDEDEEEDEDNDEEEEGGSSEFKAVGAKGLYGMKNNGRAQKNSSPRDDEDEDEEEGDGQDSEDNEEDEDEEDKPVLARADIDRYLDVNAKMSLLSRAARQLDAQNQVSTVLTTALIQLSNMRRDFLDEVIREIDVAKAEDYDSDDETEEKVELAEDETLEGFLVDASDPDMHNSYLSEYLEVPFKAKLNGERCTVVEAIGGSKLLVKQFGDSFVAKASSLTGVKGRNAAFLAEWTKHYSG